ncbi:MAG: hypothetical protein V1763_00245 [Parcubacteria group bacterium]
MKYLLAVLLLVTACSSPATNLRDITKNPIEGMRVITVSDKSCPAIFDNDRATAFIRTWSETRVANVIKALELWQKLFPKKKIMGMARYSGSYDCGVIIHYETVKPTTPPATTATRTPHPDWGNGHKVVPHGPDDFPTSNPSSGFKLQ